MSCSLPMTCSHLLLASCQQPVGAGGAGEARGEQEGQHTLSRQVLFGTSLLPLC